MRLICAITLLLLTAAPLWAGYGNCPPAQAVIGENGAGPSTCGPVGGIVPSNDSGSDAIGTCTATATSGTLTSCSGISDFAKGESLRIPGAGPASPLTAVASITVAQQGTTGSTHITYALCTADYMKGIAGCATASITNANATTNVVNPVKITFTRSTVNAAAALVYKQPGSSGPWYLVGTPNGSPFYDEGYVAQTDKYGLYEGWPTTPAAQKQDYFGTITGGGGSALQVTPAVSTTVSGGSVYHEEGPAIQAALNQCNGASVYIPAGTHNVNWPQFWNGALVYQRTFTASTTNYPNLFLTGMLSVPSNCTVYGAGRGSTIVDTTMMMGAAGGASMFGFATGQFQNPFFLSPAPTAYPINNAAQGADEIVTTTAGDAANFTQGDYVFYYGGSYDPTPYAPNEIRQVTSVNSTTGELRLDHSLERPIPYGTDAGPTQAVFKLTGQLIHDVNVHDMTIESYAGYFASVVAQAHIHVWNVDGPWEAANGFVNGGFRWDWSWDNVNITFAQQELDQSEDLYFRNSRFTTFASSAGGPSEATTNVVFDKMILNLNERYCLGGQTCNSASFGPAIGAQESCTGFQIRNSVINATCNAGANTEPSGFAIVSQGGPFGGTASWGEVITGNTINTNCAGVYQVHDIMQHLGNEFSHNVVNVDFTGGTPANSAAITFQGAATDNTITVANGSATNYTVFYDQPSASHQYATPPYLFRNNHVNIPGGPAYNCLFIGNPGSLDTDLISIDRNDFNGCATGVTIASSANLPNVLLGSNNTFVNTTTAYTPATLPRAFGCLHGLTPPTISSGSITTGGTDCSFFATGATSPATVSFATAFTTTPVCNCSDQTSATAPKVVPGTANVVVTTTGTDSFSCQCS